MESLSFQPVLPKRQAYSSNRVPKFGCAQFAHLVRQPYEGQDQFIRQCLSQGDNPLKAQSENNPDGWGIAAYKDADHLSITKSKEKAAEDPAFETAVDDTASLKPWVTLGHVRQGQNVIVENNHPFPIGKAILMHNGVVPAALQAKLREKLTAFSTNYQVPSPIGTTDTELFARYLQGVLYKEHGTGDPTAVNTEALAELFNREVSALVSASNAMTHANPAVPGFNFTLADDHRILACRSGRALHLGYRKDPDGRLQDVTIATRPMQLKTGESIDWREISPNHLVIVERETDRDKKSWVKISFQPLKLDSLTAQSQKRTATQHQGEPEPKKSFVAPDKNTSQEVIA